MKKPQKMWRRVTGRHVSFTRRNGAGVWKSQTVWADEKANKFNVGSRLTRLTPKKKKVLR